MSAWARLARLEFARIARSGGGVAAAVLLLALGVHASLQGRRSVEATEAGAVAAEEAYRAQLDHLLSSYSPETEAGEPLYYLAFPASQPPSKLAALASGRAEVEAVNMRIRLLALEGQLYEEETLNPRLAAEGRLDLVFVLVVLLPLFVVAVTYDVVSGERERGTWEMARLFADPRRILAAKVGARALLVGAVVAVLVAVGALTTDAGADGRTAWAVALVALHTLFWFALCMAVAVGRRSSTANALTLVGAWATLAFLVPAALGLANAVLHPVPEALELTVRQRQGYHEAWDLPRAETMEEFFEDYPQWSGWRVPEDEFTWAWYYAMNHRGDRAARDASRRYREALAKRDEWARRWSLLSSPLATRLAVDRLASADLTAQFAYQDAVRRHHERLKAHFQPALFSAAPIGDVDWERAPVFEPAALEESAWRIAAPTAGALALASVFALAFAVARSPGRGGSRLSRRNGRPPTGAAKAALSDALTD